jgi:hypothetical protein
MSSDARRGDDPRDADDRGRDLSRGSRAERTAASVSVSNLATCSSIASTCHAVSSGSTCSVATATTRCAGRRAARWRRSAPSVSCPPTPHVSVSPSARALMQLVYETERDRCCKVGRRFPAATCAKPRLDPCSDLAAKRRSVSPRSGLPLPDNPRVEYADLLMVVLRCTQTLLQRLKQLDEASDVESTTNLGDWYGNLIRKGNRHVLLFISEWSRLPVMVPVRAASHLRSSFSEAVCKALVALVCPWSSSSANRWRCRKLCSVGRAVAACSAR